MENYNYIESRLNDQIAWHSKKSQFNQKKYKQTKTLVIVCASLIPLLAGINVGEHWDTISKCVIGGLGVVIAVSESILSMHKYHELWLQYRVTAETLEREKILYVNKIGVYSEENTALEYLIKTTENILSEQNLNWVNTTTQKDK
jgi:Protein of unknown function (DUF4231)